MARKMRDAVEEAEKARDRRGKGPRKYAAQRNRIRELRQRAGLRAADIADRINKLGHGPASGSSILKIEKGSVDLSNRWRKGIAAALGVDPSELDLEDDGIPVLRWRELAAGRRGSIEDQEYVGWRGSKIGIFAVRARVADVHDEPPIRKGDVLICRTPQEGEGAPAMVIAADDNGALIVDAPSDDTVPLCEIIEIRHRLTR